MESEPLAPAAADAPPLFPPPLNVAEPTTFDSPETEGADPDEILETVTETDAAGQTVTVRRKRRIRVRATGEVDETRFLGRRALCPKVEAVASRMLKMIKLRVLTGLGESTRGLEDDDLSALIVKLVPRLCDKARIIEQVRTVDADTNRENLRAMLLAILLEDETHSLPETRLDEKIEALEKDLVKRSKSIDFFDQKRHGVERWHQYDTYRIVLDAAYRNDDCISQDESRLIRRLREHLHMSSERRRLIAASTAR